ncbi:MAG: hypothetical protein KAU21_15030, partial [Gammaproteobacteria bacterium]|nr:hypothetical protein [Gammaproteobacteria bacterium]
MLSFANLAAVKSTYKLSKSALYLGALLLTLLLPACGGGGGGDTPVDDGTGDVPIDSPSGGDSISNPATLAIETTYNDSITAAGLRYYKFTTDSSRAFVYEIDLLNLSSSYYWKLYTDSSFTSLLDSCYQSSDTSVCNTDKELDANTTYYLSLQEASGSNDNFTLRIRRVLSSEGSLDAPVNLTVGTAYQGTLGPKLYGSRVKSYYKFTSNVTDSTHTISLSGATTDIKWELYKGDWNTAVRDCDALWEAADESCTTAVLTGSTDYYLIVETQGPESTFVTINVTEGGTDSITTSDEGTVAAPVALTLEQAHTGSVSPDGTSYYKFTTGDVVASHLIKIEHKSTNIDLRLYSDSAFSNEVDNYQGYFGYNAFSDISWRTVALDPNATFYIKVTDSVYGGGLGDEYIITVFADAVRNPDSEGTTITPIELTPGVQYIGGTVGSLSSSYYKFTLPEAKPYKISMTNTTDADLSWSLRSDWDDLYTIIYCNGTYGIGDEI